MKKFIISLIFFNFISNAGYAEIVYIDIKYILNKSQVGISLNSYLDEQNEIIKKKYKNIEEDLIKREKSLIAQQNILDENEFKKKIKVLSNEVKKFRSNKKKSFEELNNFKVKNTKEILNFLNPIITDYVEKNSINLVLPKKNIIVGKKNMDITDKIIKLLNDKVKSLSF